MKFDVVVGNPPFNTPKKEDSTRTGQLYASFTKQALSLSPIVAFIIPSLWTDKKSTLKNLLTPHLKECFETSKYFDINVPTCGIIYDESYVGDCQITNSSGEQFCKSITDGVIPMHGNLTTHNLLSKLTSPSTLGALWKRSSVNRNNPRVGQGTINMVETVGKANEPVITTPTSIPSTEFAYFDKWKVIAGNVGEWKSLGKNLKVAPPNVGTSYSIVALGTDTESEANVLLQYLNSNLVKAMVKMIKNNTPNSKTVFNQLPQIDLSRSWTDNELYQHFNLTQKEIDLIEDTIK